MNRGTADSERIAIVTGGGSGIGESAAVALARAGWRVVVAGRRVGPLQLTASAHPELALEPVRADITDEADVRALFDGVVARHGRVDLLFNNAGRSGSAAPIDEIELDEWRAVVDLNVTGTFLCTREAFRVMRAQRPQGGRIINNGSISAHAPRPRSIAYTATKHAVTGMTKSAALDGREYGIACGQIDIGNAVTDMTSGMGDGVPQADGSLRPEPTMPVSQVGDAVVHMAGLPLTTNVLFMTVMATGMPFVGRGERARRRVVFYSRTVTTVGRARVSVTRPTDGEEARRVTWIELFFDLVFVFAITQVTHLVIADESVASIGHALLIACALWWVWVYTAWVTNWLHPAHPAVRTMLFVLMFLGLVLASAIPDAFGSKGLLFACCIVAMQVGRSAFTMVALRSHNRENSLNFVRITVWEIASGVFWVVGGLSGEHARPWIWLVALLIDSAGPASRFLVPGIGATPVHVWTVAGSHLAERAAGFVIIVLGETIVEIGTAFANEPISVSTVLALVSAFLATALFYGIYFAHGADYGSEKIAGSTENGVIARSAYSYVHVLFVVAIIFLAVAEDSLLKHPDGLEHGPVFLLPAIGSAATALYLVAMALFKWAVSGTVLFVPLVGVVLLAVLFGVEVATGGTLPPLVFGPAANAVLVIVLVWDEIRLRRVLAAG